jgi:hypothetical protein
MIRGTHPAPSKRFSIVWVTLVLLALVLGVKVALFTQPQLKNVLTVSVSSQKEHQAKEQDACFYNISSPACCSEQQCQIVMKSSMASRCCGTDPPRWPLLVTGTPRSGTVSVKGALTEMGFLVEDDWHIPDRDGMVSWIHVFSDTKYFGKGHIRGGRFGSVYHQLRDPLKSLTSVSFTEPVLNDGYLEYLNRHINVTSMPNPNATQAEKRIYTGLQFYVSWHRFIDSLKVPMFRLEDFSPHLVLEIAQNAGFSEDQINLEVIHRFFNSSQSGTIANQRPHRDTLTWPELCQLDAKLTTTFWSLSREYGYYQNHTHSPCQ